MGDKIAQLIFERINTPEIKETNELEGTGRGEKGYGSTGINKDTEISPKTKVRATPSVQFKTTESVTKNTQVQAAQDSRIKKMSMNEPIPHIKKRSHTAEARRIMSARQMQKLIKND